MSNPDLDWALNLYSLYARGDDEESLFYTVVHGDPWSKSRPRFARGRAYTKRDDQIAEQKLAWHLRAHSAQMFPGNVMLACRFYRSNLQRIDADNLLKHVCDAANEILWADDSQVTFVLAELHRDPLRPRTVIMAAHHESTLVRGEDVKLTCQHCGERFMPPPGAKDRLKRRWCSRECRFAAEVRVKDMPRTCEHCGGEYKAANSRQRFCSKSCARKFAIGKKKGATRNLSNCETCGKQLAHNRGGRCRLCWRADPKGVAS